MWSDDRLYTDLQLAALGADDLCRRLNTTGGGHEDVRVAMGKNIYKNLISQCGVIDENDTTELQGGIVRYWTGYKICVINEDEHSNSIFPVIANKHPIDIESCRVGDKIAMLADDCATGAVFELVNINGCKFFAQICEMSVSFSADVCDGIKPPCPTESEVDAFLSEYIQ